MTRPPDGPEGIVSPAAWRAAVTALLPSLRAFARSLSRSPADADDLVQETLMKAWAHRARFEAGTNLRAWLFTILRNAWYTAASRRGREVADVDGRRAAALTTEAAQEWTVELGDVRSALAGLPAEHREAIVLVCAAGLSYEEAADIAGCAVGTIKSRVNRGRAQLALALENGGPAPRAGRGRPPSRPPRRSA